MNYHIQEYTVVFANGHRHKFHDLIGHVVEFTDALILCLNTDSLHRSNQNVFAFDYQGQLLWQIPARHHSNEHSPYVGIYRAGEMIEAYNWDGQTLTLHPQSGTVISEGYISIGYSPSRRHRSPKSWM